METLTRLVLVGSLAALALSTASRSNAVPNTIAPTAQLVWVDGDRVYLASRDSLYVEPGTTISFRISGRQVATAQVTGTFEARLVSARVSSGSLLGVSGFKDIDVIFERTSVSSRRLLRVGYPSQARATQPFFRCERVRMNASGYMVDTLGTRVMRLVRDSVGVWERPRPDTLLVRLFDDVADEEIALERGELDVAVFWPGEASSHIREVMRWDGRWKVYRPRGVVAIYEQPRRDRVDALYQDARGRIQSLNNDLFRGDLLPIGANFVSVFAMAPTWFDVDSTSPGQKTIERFLNRNSDKKAAQERLYLTYEAIPAQEALEKTGCVLVIACPVLSRPELRPYLDSIDLSAIVNFFDCETTARKP